jgi:hypothetical protein
VLLFIPIPWMLRAIPHPRLSSCKVSGWSFGDKTCEVLSTKEVMANSGGVIPLPRFDGFGLTKAISRGA